MSPPLTAPAANPTFVPMFIRKTTTRNKSTAESYYTHRLVASERAGKQVRQVTLLNLGRHFELPRQDWPRLCARIEALLAGRILTAVESEPVEALAQRCFARLIAERPTPAAEPTHAKKPAPPAQPASATEPAPPPQPPPAAPSPPTAEPAPTAEPPPTPEPTFAEVDIDSLQLTRPRTVGVEAAGLAAMGWLGIDPILHDLGFNGVQRAAVAGSLIGRMAAPGSEPCPRA